MHSCSRGNEHVESRSQDNGSTKYPENDRMCFKYSILYIATLLIINVINVIKISVVAMIGRSALT